MTNFKSYEKDLEVNTVFDGEPVKLLEDGCDVVPPSLYSGDVLGSFSHLLYGFPDDGEAALTVVRILSMVLAQTFENIMLAILSLLSLQRKRSCFFSVLVMMFCFQ